MDEIKVGQQYRTISAWEGELRVPIGTIFNVVGVYPVVEDEIVIRVWAKIEAISLSIEILAVEDGFVRNCLELIPTA